MRILITGASGFIGRYVVDMLEGAEHHLALLVRNTRQKTSVNSGTPGVIVGELENLGLVEKDIIEFDPQICVHLAWHGIPDYSAKTSKLNLLNSILFIDFIASKTQCKKIIISGSCSEYGKTRGECIESENIHTNSFFSWAKHSLYDYSSLICGPSGIDLVWLRFFYVYGPGQRSDSLIPTLVRSIQGGIRPDIRNPFNSNDLVYVEDIAEAICRIIEKQVDPGIYNLGSGKASSVLDICRIVESQMGMSDDFSAQLAKKSLKSESVCFWANIAKAKKAFGWEPKHSLVEGISQYIQYANKTP